MLTFKLAALAFGVEGFGAYAVARRAISILAFPMMLGLSVSLPRCVASLPAGKGGGKGGVFLLAAWLIAVPGMAALTLGAATRPGAMAVLMFGRGGHEELVWPTVAAVLGLCGHTIVYGFEMGRMRLGAAGTLWLVNLAAVPPAAVALSGGEVPRALLGLGIGWSVASAVAGLSLAAGLRIGTPRAWGAALRELVRFGVPRMPGDLAMFGLFAVPTILVAHRSGLEPAGLVSFGLSLVQMIGSVFTAAGMLLLPIVSRLRADGRIGEARRLVDRSLMASLAAGVLIVLAAEASLATVITMLLDEGFTPAAGLARRLLPAAVPFVAYIVLRGPIDALDVWPHNAVNLGLALAVTSAVMIFGSGPMEAATASLAGFSVLGLASIWSVRRCLAKAERVSRAERKVAGALAASP
ncbi:hypothetical protein TsocGM_11535 [Tautonia sociabilis]|uniref:Lipopolysaccharide biosynthesis protein n=2 Tax=Tautonia sociabilis TaxID=2080755 RepID=A0A432MKH9_9BACT|nr:hypothetical protein TsocGM_11535 [Tautonia sociabilis]